MTLKSLLPSSSSESNGRSSISKKPSDKSTSDRSQSGGEHNSSSYSSSVKKTSPLATSCIQGTVNTDSNASTPSWITHRWSTISGSLAMQQKKKKKSATSSWKNRKKRRTYPPSKDILKQEQMLFLRGRKHSTLNMVTKKQQRQSLADILPAFYATLQNQSSTGGSSSSSSSLSKKIGRMMKKRGKQPFNLTDLRINTTPNGSSNENDKSIHRNSSDISNIVSDRIPFSPSHFVFKPPPTISSKSSSPSTPLKLLPPSSPPPRRFSAFFIDASGKSGKVTFRSRPRFWFFSKPSVAIERRQHDEEGGEVKKENNASVELSTEVCLFLFGFLLFPLWWIGVWLYFKDNKTTTLDDRSLSSLFTIRTLAYLNLMLSGVSIVLLVIIIAMLIWNIKY
ncbi:hypothetical protein K501DRAFT_286028 [Backusella circina FSU 941]|nr:hypothetical protein K501DRAFT_286028 [Backusella circina FSU 941]